MNQVTLDTADIMNRMTANVDKWKKLVLSFPVLDEIICLPTGGPDELDEWADKAALGSGAREAVRFCLAVWNPRLPWKSGSFDLFRAMRVWDNRQLQAFQAWAANPVTY